MAHKNRRVDKTRHLLAALFASFAILGALVAPCTSFVSPLTKVVLRPLAILSDHPRLSAPVLSTRAANQQSAFVSWRHAGAIIAAVPIIAAFARRRFEATASRGRSSRRSLLASRAVAAASPAPTAWRGDGPTQSSLALGPDGLPDYESIDASLTSRVLMARTRRLLEDCIGHDSPRPGYEGIMELVREINDQEGTAAELQARARGVFEGLLPSLGIGWVPALWKRYIQPNTPEWLQNAAFVAVFHTLFPWLMGPIEGDDFTEVKLPPMLRRVLFFLPESVQVPQSIKAERCRFLENAQCASVCVNSCKVPVQEWLGSDFAMPVHVQPNYDDFSCRWKFSQQPPPLHEDEAVMVPCFARCNSKAKGTKDALSLRQKLRAEEDRRLEAAVAELTPDGTALSAASLEARSHSASKAGKCWSVDEDRLTLRDGRSSPSGATATSAAASSS